MSFLIIPLALTSGLAFLLSRQRRELLRNCRTLAAFLGVSLIWIATILWVEAFRHAADGPPAPVWAYGPTIVALIGWPISAVTLTIRIDSSRAFVLGYVIFNGFAWALTCFVSVMAISGDWL
jgi:hypothetical protein